jgi:signal transduction histidine kinase
MDMPLNPRFLSLVVHDLRTPLNVIGLSLRMIDQAVPHDDAELDEDLRIIRENVAQMDRMLSYLGDYCRLIADPARREAVRFDPRRLLDEVAEALTSRLPAGASRIQQAVEEGCPPDVELDPVRSRLALQHVLNNAIAAADGRPVRVTLGGSPDRLVVEVHVDRPVRASVRPTELRPDSYERLTGTADDRLGLDLAIAARVTELFGGTARLEVEPERGTTVVLDWPASPKFAATGS